MSKNKDVRKDFREVECTGEELLSVIAPDLEPDQAKLLGAVLDSLAEKILRLEAQLKSAGIAQRRDSRDVVH